MIQVPLHTELEEAIVTHEAAVFSVCRRITRDSDSAWEAFQETFLVLSRQWETIDHDRDLGPWLRETARRCSLAILRQRIKHQSVVTAVEADCLAASGDSVDQVAIRREQLRVLAEEFAGLPKQQQQILTLCCIDDVPHRSVARTMQCAPGSVYSKVKSAREELQGRLRKRGVALTALLLAFFLQEENAGVWAATVSTNTVSDGALGNASGTSGFGSARKPVERQRRLLFVALALAACLALIVTWFSRSSPPAQPPMKMAPLQTASVASFEVPIQYVEICPEE